MLKYLKNTNKMQDFPSFESVKLKARNIKQEWGGGASAHTNIIPVSYTHLDVYKRQN